MDNIILKSKHISVEILNPGTVYTRSRFDWTGIVKQVTLGNTKFLGTEADDNGYSGSEGIGLSTEFGISTPIAYWKTFPGFKFMKIGVGALKRKSILPYSFFKDYPITIFNTQVKAYDNRVEFKQIGCEVASYKYDYIKTITIEKNSLTISYKLKNTGTSTIKTEEYCHNFFRLGDSDITKNFVVNTNHDIKSRKTVGDIVVEPRGISFNKDVNETIYTYSTFKEKPTDFYWEIINKDNGTKVKCTEDIPVSKFALWGMKHVISPESFYSFKLKPGHELTWNRRYEFS